MNIALVLCGFLVVAILAKKLGLLLLLVAITGVVFFLIATQAWGILTLLAVVAVLLVVSRLYIETHK